MANERRPPRGGASEPQLITIYWRDIPAQVMARAGAEKARAALGGRFQTAIRRAAANAGKRPTYRDLDEWREERAPCAEDVEREVDAAMRRLEHQYPDEVLDERIRNAGWAP